MGRLSLDDALSLVGLYAAVDSPKLGPAAVRWLARLGLEERGVTLTTMQLAAEALVQLCGKYHDDANARETLLRLLWGSLDRVKA